MNIPEGACCNECGREDRELVRVHTDYAHYYLCDRHVTAEHLRANAERDMGLWLDMMTEFLDSDKSNDWTEELTRLDSIRERLAY